MAWTNSVRMKLAPLSFLFVALLVAACGGGEVGEQIIAEGPEALADLAVEVDAPAEDDTLNARRSMFFADGSGAFFFDAAAASPDNPAMGFSVDGTHVLESWDWWIDEDSTLLGRMDRSSARVRPDFAVRSYVERDTSGFFENLLNRFRGGGKAEITERITLLDHVGALLIEVPDSIGIVAFRPSLSDGHGATAEGSEGTLLSSYRVGSDTLWTAIRSDDGTASSAEVSFSSPGSVVVVVGKSARSADSLAQAVLRNASRLKTERGTRMAEILEASYIQTEEEEINDALAWARLSLDALVVSDSSETVLMPGIPGSEPIPGRSILSNLNAMLDVGDWETARNLLTTYGQAQRFDERLDILGRAPNVVLPGGEGQFTTADATAIYLAAAGDYVQTTGDRSLVSGGSNFWFKMAFAMRGLYFQSRRHGRQVDSTGFLRVASNETWMQSSSTKPGLATARGGYPVEAQGSLYRALRAAASFAGIMGVARREGSSWYADSANVLLRSFPGRFVLNGRLVDHLNASGEAAADVYPNALFALRDFNLPLEEKARLSRRVAEQLAYSYGLSTRVQSDSLFHPFLNEPSSYSQTDALFNGAVWTWLNGPLVSLLAQTGGVEFASELFTDESALVEGSGIIGAIPDNIDAHPRKRGDAPITGGTPVQPWSLAEYIRNAYKDFVGISYASADTLVIDPNVPEGWGETEARVRLGNGAVTMRVDQSDNAVSITATPVGDIPHAAALRVRAFGMENTVSLILSESDSTVIPVEQVTVQVSSSDIEVNGESVTPSARYTLPDAAWWAGFSWLEPVISDRYAVMRTATARRILAPNEILRDNPSARSILTETDPDGDDWGASSTYTYPPDFPPSILDATYLEVAQDDSATYFRAEFVALPNADPSSTFQTFVAFAMSTESGGANRVGRNASYDFPRNEGYEYVVFVGDGIVVENARGQVLGEVPPGRGIAFDPATSSLSFALPRFVLPDLPRNSIVTLLVGAREDGNGVGEFRTVNRTASGQFGGGKVNARSPNVYDVVSARVSR